MPIYQITAPNGKTYRIEGPDGASDEQIRAEVLRQFPDADPTLKRFPDTVRGPDIAEQPSTLDHLAAGAQSAVAGAAQGVAGGVYDFPMGVANMVQQGTNALLGAGVGGALDLVGLDSAADWWRRGADRAGNALANLPTASGAIEQLSPTPQGMEGARLASQIVGGAMVPIGPRGAPRPVRAPAAQNEAAQVIEAGQREGVRVMTSDVRQPRTFLGKSARALGERIPFAGTAGPRLKQQEERIAAVKDLAREFGIEGTEEVIDEVADDLAKTRGGRLAALKGRKDRVIDGISGTAPASKALEALDEQIAAMVRRDTPASREVAEVLRGQRAELAKPRSLRGLEDFRADELSKAFDTPATLASVKTVGEKALRKIYAPLREDMGAFIRQRGGDEAFNAWKKSNDELAAMAGELDASAFKGVLNSAETTPENVARLLFSKKPSDVRRLYANLSPKGKEKAKSAVIYEAIRKAGGLEDVSPQKFANSLKDFGRTTGIIFGDDAPRIEGIVRLLRATQQASVAAAAPPTGVQNTVPVVAAVLADWMGGAGAAMGTAGMAGAAARLYESAPVRNLLVGLSKTKPGSRAEGAFLERIGKALVSQVEIQAGRTASNDNARLASEIAAQPQEQ